jgi:toxin CcdB
VASRQAAITRLCPIISVLGEEVMLSTPEIAGYPARDLGPRVMSASDHRSEILAAIDFLLSGF